MMITIYREDGTMIRHPSSISFSIASALCKQWKNGKSSIMDEETGEIVAEYEKGNLVYISY